MKLSFSTPHQPPFSGHDLFYGRQIYSHNYRDEELFQNKLIATNWKEEQVALILFKKWQKQLAAKHC